MIRGQTTKDLSLTTGETSTAASKATSTRFNLKWLSILREAWMTTKQGLPMDSLSSISTD